MDRYSTPIQNVSKKRAEYPSAIDFAPKKAKHLKEAATNSLPYPGILAVFDHWWYTVYSDDIHDTLRERELLRKSFMDRAPQAEHREEIIGLIRQMGVLERLSRTTIHLAIYVLDIFMDNHHIPTDSLVIVTICSVLLAAKIEEPDHNIPRLANLCATTNSSFLLSNFVVIEAHFLRFFDFQMMIPTAATFLEYFIEGIVDNCDYEASDKNRTRFNSLMAMKRELTDLALEFVDLILLNVYTMQELPSKMASACLAAARCTLDVGEVWPYHLQILTKYSFDKIGLQMRQLQILRFKVINEIAVAELQGIAIITPDSGYNSHISLDETDSSAEE